MPTNRYALADYQLTVTIPVNSATNTNDTGYMQILQRAGLQSGTTITIGGPGEGEGKYGSFVGSINVKRNKELWTTEGDATGSWVHNKNLDRTGTIDVEITQVSSQVVQLVYLCNAYESVSDAVGGLHLEIKNIASGENIADAIDCYIAKAPDHPFGDTAAKLTFSFTCGRITYYN